MKKIYTILLSFLLIFLIQTTAYGNLEYTIYMDIDLNSNFQITETIYNTDSSAPCQLYKIGGGIGNEKTKFYCELSAGSSTQTAMIDDIHYSSIYFKCQTSLYKNDNFNINLDLLYNNTFIEYLNFTGFYVGADFNYSSNRYSINGYCSLSFANTCTDHLNHAIFIGNKLFYNYGIVFNYTLSEKTVLYVGYKNDSYLLSDSYDSIRYSFNGILGGIRFNFK